MANVEGQAPHDAAPEQAVEAHAFDLTHEIMRQVTIIEAACVSAEPHFGLVWAMHDKQFAVEQGHFKYTTYYPWSGEEANPVMLLSALWLRNYEGMDCPQLRSVMEKARAYRLAQCDVPDLHDASERIQVIYEALNTLTIGPFNQDAAEPWNGTWFLAVEIPLALHDHLNGDSRGMVHVLGHGHSIQYPALSTIRDTLKLRFTTADPIRLQQEQDAHEIDALFELGEGDAVQDDMPESLEEREREALALVNTFDRVVDEVLGTTHTNVAGEDEEEEESDGEDLEHLDAALAAMDAARDAAHMADDQLYDPELHASASSSASASEAEAEDADNDSDREEGEPMDCSET